MEDVPIRDESIRLGQFLKLANLIATGSDAKELMVQIGKLPVVCGPAPGYIVPRLQALVMNEAARMIEEGAATAEEIDKATRYGLGLRFAALGVVEFIDFGGSDILHHASREMSGFLLTTAGMDAIAHCLQLWEETWAAAE